MLIDTLAFVGFAFLVFYIRQFTSVSVSMSPMQYWLHGLLFYVSIMSIRMLVGVYRNVWRYAVAKPYLLLICADVLGGLAGISFTRMLRVYTGIWQSITLVTLFSVATVAMRLIYQYQCQYLATNSKGLNKIGVVIVGAGQTGVMLANELMYNKRSHYEPICFIDTDQNKVGNSIYGIKVLAEDDDIIGRLKTLPVQEIFFAFPNANEEKIEQMYQFYSQTGCKIKIYDFPFSAIGGATHQNATQKRTIREIDIEDLLFRNSLKINGAEIDEFYTGKTVLVTGGGGSIGSELCRQVAKRNPKHLVILDIYENNAYSIQQELLRVYGNELRFSVEIGSVRDVERLEAVFAHYRPEIVFHAAAHKHVPLMEHSAGEAIKNNVMGTYHAANAAERYGVKQFILISTDKAVNPTNIMGASKRMCEMIVQSRHDSGTTFSAVRFGNVLGSNGSVIHLFKQQIAGGGPITITDKRIIRYFMTIPEASQLVMKAGAMAKCGELFVLDMGKPVKILDLAENMIRLSGLTPYEDIDIVEIGLRPGEKLYEELLIKTEELVKTSNDLIYIEKDKPLTREEVGERLSILLHAVESCETSLDIEPIKGAMRQVVPSYCNPDEINLMAENVMEMRVALKI